MSATEIIPNLWIGNKNSCKDANFKQIYNIKCVVNCTNSIEFYGTKHQNYRIPVDDDLTKYMNDVMFHYLPKIVKIIKKHLDNYEGVLVHCHAGMQRSAATVAAYLLTYSDLDLKTIIKLIRSKRKICFKPLVNFSSALTRYEKIITEERMKDLD